VACHFNLSNEELEWCLKEQQSLSPKPLLLVTAARQKYRCAADGTKRAIGSRFCDRIGRSKISFEKVLRKV